MPKATPTSNQGHFVAAAKPSRATMGICAGDIDPGGPTPLITATRVRREPSTTAHAIA